MRSSTEEKLTQEAHAIAHGVPPGAIASTGRQRLEALYPLLAEGWQSGGTLRDRMAAKGHPVSLRYLQALVKAAEGPWGLELRQGKGVRKSPKNISQTP